MFAAFRFVTDALLGASALFVAFIIYTLYIGDPSIVNAIYCHANTSTDLGYSACMFMRN